MLTPALTTLALAEDTWVTIGIFAIANVIGGAGMWMHLHVRIKAIEVQQASADHHQQNAEANRMRFEERIGEALERTSHQLSETTKRLDVLIARIEERDRHDRT